MAQSIEPRAVKAAPLKATPGESSNGVYPVAEMRDPTKDPPAPLTPLEGEAGAPAPEGGPCSPPPDQETLRRAGWDMGVRRASESYAPPHNHVALAMVHPFHGFAHWRIVQKWIDDTAWSRGQAWFHCRLILRLYDVSFITFVNRVWGHYFGVGIVHPVDDFSLANPPSNDKLLNVLALDFVQNKFDIRRLERLILQSRTYQLTSTPNDTNRLDHTNYSHSFIRPMLAEVVVDVINAAAGTKETFGVEAPAGCRAIEVGSSRVQNQTVGYVLRIFGRPPRTSPCDCERTMEPGLPQKLFLIADPNMQRKITDPTNRLKDLLSRHKDDNAALDELLIATLTRLPNDKERASFLAYREKSKNRQTAYNDLLWVIVNTTEFIFNH